MDKHGITILIYISVDLAHHKIFHAKVGKSGIKMDNAKTMSSLPLVEIINFFSQLLIMCDAGHVTIQDISRSDFIRNEPVASLVITNEMTSILRYCLS